MTPPLGPLGTSRERTRLAWLRTVLAAGAVAVLAVRLSVHSGLSWLGALGVPCWVIVLALAQRRIRATGRDRPVPAGFELATVALTVMGFALLGTALVVLPR
jgi:uncharacterized membrane protein YidH (DUF202 family)